MIPLPTDPRFHERLQRCRNTYLPCAVCGREINPTDNPPMLRTRFGAEACTEAEAAEAGNDAWEQAVGRDCLKRHPELKPYLVPTGGAR